LFPSLLLASLAAIGKNRKKNREILVEMGRNFPENGSAPPHFSDDAPPAPPTFL
jgi:hypothetical protein